jgi:hypothetical protein
MRYTVTVNPDADEELADIWMRAANKNDVTRAFHLVEQSLGSDPLKSAYPDGDRFWHIELPLAVYFSFSPDDCMESILHITMAM